MRRDTTEPTPNQYGDDTHPAFGFAKVNRVHATPGAVLFDSDVQHQEFVRVTLGRMTRKRDLKQDWLHADQEMVEVDMSLAQWGAFVSSFGTSGVPCTIRRTETDWNVPGLAYAPRLAESLGEVRDAAREAFAAIQAAMDAVEALDGKAPAREKREAMRTLKYAIANAPSNVEFASKQLTEYAEDVVAKSRADIEAMINRHAQQLGLTAEQSAPLALESGAL
jgi:hypothetical protein